MLTKASADAFKDLAPLLIEQYPQGAIFGLIEGNTIVWELSSQRFSLDIFKVGSQISAEGGTARAIREKQTVTANLPRSIYGTRVSITASPIWEDDKVVGALAICMPRLHPVARAFNDFAPIMVNMFAEGACIYMSDLEKIAYSQSSPKLNIPDLNAGMLLKEGAIAREAILTKSIAVRELEASVYGMPLLIMSYPLFDEDDSSQVVGTFSIALPKNNAVQLREVSANMEKGMTEMAAVMEELAASASQINNNEIQLNKNVQEVYKLSEDINGVLNFIKQIADQTKMLGLNAAIEAARAGEVGRGFGVVAEEIRKLSDESKDTVASIRTLTDSIKNKITDTINSSDSNMRASEEQAAATQELTASIEEITSLATTLEKMAKDM